MENKIQTIKKYVEGLPPANWAAHGLDHVERVSKWAVKIAKAENYPDLEIIEAAALLHDVGRSLPNPKKENHGQLGAPAVEKFLIDNNLFKKEEIDKIVDAVRYHSSQTKTGNVVLDIVRDADIIDLLGAVGILRAGASRADLDIYNPENPRGKTWGLSSNDFNKEYFDPKKNWTTLPDQINFQLSCFDNLATNTAKQIAAPMVEFMKNFNLRIDKEAEENGK